MSDRDESVSFARSASAPSVHASSIDAGSSAATSSTDSVVVVVDAIDVAVVETADSVSAPTAGVETACTSATAAMAVTGTIRTPAITAPVRDRPLLFGLVWLDIDPPWTSSTDIVREAVIIVR